MIDKSKFTEIIDGIWYENDTGLPWSSRVKGTYVRVNYLTPIKVKADGYFHISIRQNKKQKWHLWHRMVYSFFKGNIPEEMQIDHIDNNRENCLISNLQLLSNQTNTRKCVTYKNNKTGFPGVIADGDKFRASIGINGKRKHIGRFTSPQDAYEAYLQAKIKYHGAESIAPLTNKRRNLWKTNK